MRDQEAIKIDLLMLAKELASIEGFRPGKWHDLKFSFKLNDELRVVGGDFSLTVAGR
jgi:hypothetical protein